MPTVTREPAQEALQNHLGFARRSYYSRMVGLALGFVMIAAVLVQIAAPAWMWLGPALHCFVGPHVAWWLARRSPNPREAERCNLLVDHFLGGVWMVLMQFNLLPSVLAVSLLSMDSMAGGGVRLVVRGLVLQALGVALGVAFLGLHLQLDATRWTLLACLPLLVCQPILISLIARRAIHRLKQQSRALEHQSQHDGLSGLYNRSHWELLVRAEFARFRRQNQPAVLVMADLDHFKRINDLYGHAAGDQAISRFAAALQRVLRETDVCGRYGGEEFGLLLSMTSASDAREVLDRLRRNLHDQPLLDGVLVTASFGVAELTADVPTVEAWLRLADQMLYRAKHRGRDCVVALGEDTPSQPGALLPVPTRPSYSTPAALGDPLRVTQLLAGLEISEAPFALFDPSDRLAVANKAFLQMFAVPPDAMSFADVVRHSYTHRVGPRIATDDIEAWLRAADGKRRSQPQRNFLVDMCDGRWFQVFETSYSDGWLMLLLFETQPAAVPASAAVLG
ncbi:diguanylate cyclase [Rhodoferax sp. WC2427]|uniref:diguanylate cyclase n=1 Tax=Rhodoferax sp. WC2427 TaxID=3234144 RepID=UPI003466324E